MTRYSDAELEALLANLESDQSERKETLSDSAAKKVREAICAFANDLPANQTAGVVFVGAKDDGTPAGTPITDRMLQALGDMKTDGNILPLPTLSVATRTLRGAEMAVVTVEPSDAPPVRYRGQTWIRVGPRRGLASAQDERILNEKRRYRDRHFDARPIQDATLADLNRRLFEEEYLPAAVDPDVLAANERTVEQRLAATRMIEAADDPTPTVLGLLVLSPRAQDFLPGAYVQFLRIAGVGLGDAVVDTLDARGTLAEVIQKVEGKLVTHNRRAVDFTSAPLEQQTQPYPLVALQQFVRNAVMHRTYEDTAAPVHVYWFDDRIEIRSPGGPYGRVTEESFGQPGEVDYRNPGIAEAMRVLGFVQRFGAGIATARRRLAENGNPEPEFGLSPNTVLVTVRPAP